MTICPKVISGLALALVALTVSAEDETSFSWPGGSFALKYWSANRITPTLQQGDRRIVFAYRTDGWLDYGDRQVSFTTDDTNAFVRLERTKDGLRADYVQTLVAVRGKKRKAIGVVSNSIEAVASSAHVTATIHPFFPGQLRFSAAHKAAQVIVFQDYPKTWVGGILDMTDELGRFHMNRLQSHEEFDFSCWGLNVNAVGGQRLVRIGFVPDVWNFVPGPAAHVEVNRYVGGFEMSFAGTNEKRRVKPVWTGPETFDYTIRIDGGGTDGAGGSNER